MSKINNRQLNNRDQGKETYKLKILQTSTKEIGPSKKIKNQLRTLENREMELHLSWLWVKDWPKSE